jgi:hypothetical protein
MNSDLVNIFRKMPKKALNRYLDRIKKGWRVLSGDRASMYSDYKHGHKYG